MTLLRVSLLTSLLVLLLGPESALARELAEVVLDTDERVLIEVVLDDLRFDDVWIDGERHVRIGLPDEAPLEVAGAPDLPSITRSLAIPDDACMRVTVLETHAYQLEDVLVAPSRGTLPRTVQPRDVPYSFGADYDTDAFYPAEVAVIGEPYILRDVRGVVVDFHPVQYNPQTRVLRIIERALVEVYTDGPGQTNVLNRGPRGLIPSFDTLYSSHFLNYDPARYPPMNEEGSMLIIAHDEWLDEIEPLAEYKRSIGIDTEVVAISEVGNNPPDIMTFILDSYLAGNVAFVLLVGDAEHVATPQASGGASDPSYAKVEGSDDYPDVLIGRFSAESASDVEVQVTRTLEYEQLPATAQDWFKRGVGLGSNEGPGDDNEMDWEHVDRIRDDLLAYGYSEVDQIYDPGAHSSDVIDAIDDGRGIVNYCGHGSMNSWVTSGFSNNHVDQLVNDDAWPFIHSVACNNGEFDHGTCFGEAWLRATQDGRPTGAVAAYMSSISQSWNPPMAAQDETVDLLVAEEYFSLGALLHAGSALMIDEYGGDGVSMYDTWHLFGDPSLRVFGSAAPPVGLGVSPFDAFEAQGDAGGPFEPYEIVYALENYGDQAIDFEVTWTAEWLDVDLPSGTLEPLATQDVTVSLNTAAEALIEGQYDDEITFTNTTDGEGDTTRAVGLQVGEPRLQYEWILDEDPGWTSEGEWAFGRPTGGGGSHGNSDPTAGFTGEFVYGYNLDGDYTDDLAETHLTTERLDMANVSGVTLRFRRWLGVEGSEYDHAYVRVSTDGQSWTTVWENSDVTSDPYWTLEEYDLSEVADGQESVFLRWTMGSTDGGVCFCGWNIDDIQIWGLGFATCWDDDGDGYSSIECGGDDCDDTDETIHPGADEVCDDAVDNDCDGAVDDDDPDCADEGDEVPLGELSIGAGDCSCRAVASPTPSLATALALAALLAIRRRR